MSIAKQGRSRLRVYGLLLFCPWFACVDQPPRSAGVQRHAITHGVEDLGHPKVGILNRPGGQYCTATLIGSRSVLTAAHCVEADGEYSFELEQGIYPAQEVIIHPLFALNISLPELPGAGSVWYDNDLGVALLSEEVLGLRPAGLLLEPPQLGEAITLVGFGSSTQGTSRIKHRAENVIGALGDKYLLYGDSLGLTGGPATTCSGDSGGPTFILREGKELLVGAHSMSGPSCEGYGYDMRVGYFIHWLKEITQQNLGVTGDHTPPTVSFRDPPREIHQATPLTIIVEAHDKETRVVSIELRVDGQYLGSATESPAFFELSGLTPGEHELRAVAADERGNTAEASALILVLPSETRDGGGDLRPDATVEPERTDGGCGVSAPTSAPMPRGAPPGWMLLLLAPWGVRRRRIRSWSRRPPECEPRCTGHRG